MLDLKTPFATEVNAPEACARIRAYETLAAWTGEDEQPLAAEIVWERWAMENDDSAKAALVGSLKQLLEFCDPRLVQIYCSAADHASPQVRQSANELFVDRCPPNLRRRLEHALPEVSTPVESMVELAWRLYTKEEQRPILMRVLKRGATAGCENAWPKLHQLLGKRLPGFLRELARTVEPSQPAPTWLKSLVMFAINERLYLRPSQAPSEHGRNWSFPTTHRRALLSALKTVWSRCNYSWLGGTADLTAKMVVKRHELELDQALLERMIRCQMSADVAVDELIENPNDCLLSPLAQEIWNRASDSSQAKAAAHWAPELLPVLAVRLETLRKLSRRCRRRDQATLCEPWRRYLHDACCLVGSEGDSDLTPPTEATLILFARVNLASKLLRFEQLQPLHSNEVHRCLPYLNYIDGEEGLTPGWVVAGIGGSTEQLPSKSFAVTVASFEGWNWKNVFALQLPPWAFPGFLRVDWRDRRANKQELGRLLAQIQNPMVRLMTDTQILGSTA